MVVAVAFPRGRADEGAPATAPAPAVPGGTLLIVGGGRIPDAIRDRFVELAGGPAGRIVVIPASRNGDDPVRAGFSLAMWKDSGVAAVELLHARDRAQADDPAFAAPLKQATAVWLGGGQQGWFGDVYAGTFLERELRALLDRGGVVGGTSAGAAAMSKVMIVGGREEPRIGTGFGLLPDVVIDQHFLRRSRINRLIALVAKHPDQLGLGIDERTALEVPLSDRRARVLGESYVMSCLASGDGQPPRFRVLKAGDVLPLPAPAPEAVAVETKPGSED
jgi:cyanophycinase